MWRSKLRQLLSSPAELLATSSDGNSTFSGKYLQINQQPYALGKLIGEGDEAQVFELISLRRGYFDHVVKICKHKIGSSAYRNWALTVKDEVNPHSSLPEVESIPALLFPLQCGGIVKIQPYISPNPETDWRSSYPARSIVERLQSKLVSEAEVLCHKLIRAHGEKAILLEQLALIHVIRDELEEARELYERSVSAHKAEGNSGVLAVLYNLALTLLKLHGTESLQDMMEIDLGNGMIHRQRIIPVDEIDPKEPTDLSDVALEVLIESLSLEPYFSSALLVLCDLITVSEAESFQLASGALVSIDPHHPAAYRISERLESLKLRQTQPQDVGEHPPEVPAHVRELLTKLSATYEPPVPAEAQEAESLYFAALSHESRRDYLRAERDLTRACSLDPSNAKFIVELAEIYCSQGKWTQAKNYIAQVVDSFSDDWRVYELLGRINSELEDPRAACIAFHKTLACNPPEPWTITARLGMSYCHLDRMDVAMAYLEEAYGNSPADWLVNLYLLQGLKRLALDPHQNEDKASKALIQRASAILEKAREEKIMNGPLFFIKAQFFMLQLRVDDALLALEDGLRLDPNDSYAKEMIDKIKRDLERGVFKQTTLA